MVEMRTKSGISKRLRFTSRNTLLPGAALPVPFLAVDVSILVGLREANTASDGFLFVDPDFDDIEIETKGFFRFIIGCMTSACVRSPSAKIRRFTAFLCLVFFVLLRGS